VSYKTHGRHQTKEYHAWENMKARCNKPQHPQYANYGGRGITYDPRWEIFENFFADMGICLPDLSLDRIDNEKGYNNENCRWASRKEQNANRRANQVRGPGLKGVWWVPNRKKWCSQVVKADGGRITVYWGPDFFEAVCARKSWEAAQGQV
jgi:hypothetical protein